MRISLIKFGENIKPTGTSLNSLRNQEPFYRQFQQNQFKSLGNLLILIINCCMMKLVQANPAPQIQHQGHHQSWLIYSLIR
jgi:hypothetical protein